MMMNPEALSVVKPPNPTHNPISQTKNKQPMEKFREAVFKIAEISSPNKTLTHTQKTHIEKRLTEFFSDFHTPNHPPYGAMIERAIGELNEDGGSTEGSISEYIKKEYDDLPWAHFTLLKHHLGKLCDCGEIFLTRKGCYLLAGTNPSPKSSTRPKREHLKRKQKLDSSKGRGRHRKNDNQQREVSEGQNLSNKGQEEVTQKQNENNEEKTKMVQNQVLELSSEVIKEPIGTAEQHRNGGIEDEGPASKQATRKRNRESGRGRGRPRKNDNQQKEELREMGEGQNLSNKGQEEVTQKQNESNEEKIKMIQNQVLELSTEVIKEPIGTDEQQRNGGIEDEGPASMQATRKRKRESGRGRGRPRKNNNQQKEELREVSEGQNFSNKGQEEVTQKQNENSEEKIKMVQSRVLELSTEVIKEPIGADEQQRDGGIEDEGPARKQVRKLKREPGRGRGRPRKKDETEKAKQQKEDLMEVSEGQNLCREEQEELTQRQNELNEGKIEMVQNQVLELSNEGIKESIGAAEQQKNEVRVIEGPMREQMKKSEQRLELRRGRSGTRKKANEEKDDQQKEECKEVSEGRISCKEVVQKENEPDEEKVVMVEEDDRQKVECREVSEGQNPCIVEQEQVTRKQNEPNEKKHDTVEEQNQVFGLPNEVSEEKTGADEQQREVLYNGANGQQNELNKEMVDEMVDRQNQVVELPNEVIEGKIGADERQSDGVIGDEVPTREQLKRRNQRQELEVLCNDANGRQDELNNELVEMIDKQNQVVELPNEVIEEKIGADEQQSDGVIGDEGPTREQVKRKEQRWELRRGRSGICKKDDDEKDDQQKGEYKEVTEGRNPCKEATQKENELDEGKVEMLEKGDQHEEEYGEVSVGQNPCINDKEGVARKQNEPNKEKIDVVEEQNQVFELPNEEQFGVDEQQKEVECTDANGQQNEANAEKVKMVEQNQVVELLNEVIEGQIGADEQQKEVICNEEDGQQNGRIEDERHGLDNDLIEVQDPEKKQGSGVGAKKSELQSDQQKQSEFQLEEMNTQDTPIGSQQIDQVQLSELPNPEVLTIEPLAREQQQKVEIFGGKDAPGCQPSTTIAPFDLPVSNMVTLDQSFLTERVKRQLKRWNQRPSQDSATNPAPAPMGKMLPSLLGHQHPVLPELPNPERPRELKQTPVEKLTLITDQRSKLRSFQKQNTSQQLELQQRPELSFPERIPQVEPLKELSEQNESVEKKPEIRKLRYRPPKPDEPATAASTTELLPLEHQIEEQQKSEHWGRERQLEPKPHTSEEEQQRGEVQKSRGRGRPRKSTTALPQEFFLLTTEKLHQKTMYQGRGRPRMTDEKIPAHQK